MIVVNDNPENFSQEFFDGLALPDFVTVIHQKQNIGLPCARNTGIKAAKGQYLAFLDADDFYTHMGLRQMLDQAIQSGVDLTHGQTIQTGVNRLSGQALIEESRHFSEKNSGVYRGDTVIDAGFNASFCWSFIYHADFLRKNLLLFDIEQRKFEDRIFVIDALKAADSLAIMGKPTHVWQRRANTITTGRADFDARNMRIASFEKSIQKWSSVAGVRSRDLMLREMLGHGFEAISRHSASVFRGETSDISQDQRRMLQNRYLAVIDEIGPTQADIRKHFGPEHRRFTHGTTERMLISVEDMITLYAAMRARDLKTVESFLTQVLATPTKNPKAAALTPTNESLRVILHLGMHNTVTTAIQKQLDHNRKYLAENGV